MKTSLASRTGLLAVSALAGMSVLMAPLASAATTVNAGDQINTSGGKCTLGFIVEGQSGKSYGLTAGHCGDPGQTISVRGDKVGKYIESEAAPSVMGSLSTNDGSGDWAVIEFNDGVEVNPAGDFGQDRTPIAAGQVENAPQVGQRVCTQGSTTGYACGKITRVDAEGGWIFTNITRIPGDSGGPLYDATTGKAVGVLSTVGVSGNGVQSRYFSVDKAINSSPALSGATGSDKIYDPRESTGSLNSNSVTGSDNSALDSGVIGAVDTAVVIDTGSLNTGLGSVSTSSAGAAALGSVDLGAAVSVPDTGSVSVDTAVATAGTGVLDAGSIGAVDLGVGLGIGSLG